jgi:hypothetical protein
MVAASGGNYIDVSLDIIPNKFEISAVYPNPFNPIATIDYSIPKESYLTVKIYDVVGNEVATLVDDVQFEGSYSIQWDAKDYSSGIYFVRFNALGKTNVRKLMLMK